MNKAVSKVLNSVLGDFIENLNPDQLNLSIFSGTISLENLRVKSEALDKLGLPFKLGSGYVGTIQVEIPWTSLGSSPLKVIIKDVIVLLLPHPKSQWDEQEQRTINQKSRRSQIDKFEVMNSEEVSVESSPGMVEKLITKIVDNIQIELKNVYIRVEDSESFSQKFALGLKIEEISCFTCNSSWEPQFMESSLICFKLIKLKNFAVYSDFGDGFPLVAFEHVPGMQERQSFEHLAQQDFGEQIPHRYLISPISLRIELIMNKNVKDISKPQYAVCVTSKSIKVGVAVTQLTHFIKLGEYISQFFQFREGVAKSETYKTMTQEDVIRYRTTYGNWKKFSVDNNKQSKKFAEENLTELQRMEEIFEVSDIIKQREEVINEIGVKKLADAKRKEIEDIKESYKPSKASSMKSWFGYGKSEDTLQKEKDEMEAKIAKCQQELEEILAGTHSEARNEILQLVEGVDTFDEKNMPEMYDRFTFQLNIARQSFHLDSAKSMLSSLEILNTYVNVAMKPASMVVEAKINSMHITDNICEGNRNMMESGHLQVKYSTVGVNSVDVSSGDLCYNVNIGSLLEIYKTFQKELIQEIDSEFYQKQANARVNYYVELSKQYVGEAVAQTESAPMKINLSLSAPKFKIPLDLERMENGYFVLDFGHFNIFNGDEQFNGTRYEFYAFELTNFKLGGSESDILEPVTFEFKFMTTKEKNVTPMIINAKLEKIKMNFSDELIQTGQEFQKKLMKTLEPILQAPGENPVLNNQVSLQENTNPSLSLAKEESIEVSGEPSSAMKVLLEIKEISTSIFYKKSEILSCAFKEFGVEYEMFAGGRMGVDLSLKRMDILDLRENVYFRAIMSNPQVTSENGTDIVLEDQQLSSNEIYQVRAGVIIDGKQGITQASALVNGIRIILVHSFIKSVLELSKSFVGAASPQAPSQSPSPSVIIEKPIEDPKSISSTMEISLSLSCLEVWLPLSESSDCQIASINWSPIIHYNSLHTTENSSPILIDDELALEVRHFTIQLGTCKSHLILPNSWQVQDFITPSRIIINFSSKKENKNALTVSEAEINLESIYITTGFRDIDFFKELAAKWTSITPEQSGNSAQVVAQPQELQAPSKDILRVVLLCDSLQLTLIQDKLKKSYELLHASFSNFGANVQVMPQLAVTFTTIFLMNYYNLNVASWEPLIEDWVMEINVIQDENKRFNINFCSSEDLNINVTYDLMKMIGTMMYAIGNKAKIEKTEEENKYETKENLHKDIEYKVVNLLGKDVYIKIDKDNIEETLITDTICAYYSQKSLNQIYSKKGTSKNIRAPAKLIMRIGENWSKAFGMEDSKTKGRKIGDEIVIIEVECRNNERIIKIQSNKTLMNNTHINLKIASKLGEIELPSFSSVPLPTNWLNESLTCNGTILDRPTLITNPTSEESESDKCIAFEILELKVAKKMTQSFFQFNPPIVLRNLLPCTLTYISSENQSGFINPGSSRDIYNVKKLENFKLRAHNSPREKITTEVCRLENIFEMKPTEKMNLKVAPLELEGEEDGAVMTATSLTMDISKKSYLKNDTTDLRSRELKKSKKDENIEEAKWCGAKLIEVYTPFIIVNKTEHNLIFSTEENVTVYNRSIGFLSHNEKKLQAKLETNSEWSRNFNIDAAGVADSIDIKYRPEDTEDISIGIIRENASSPMIKSTVIKFVPRYVIENGLNFDISLLQLENGKLVEIELKSGEKKAFTKFTHGKKRLLRAKAGGHEWGPLFDIDALFDYQMRIPAEKPDQIEIPDKWKGLAAFFRSIKWNLPNSSNEYHYTIRVITTTEDQATIFVHLSLPDNPEFVVINQTAENLKAKAIKKKIKKDENASPEEKKFMKNPKYQEHEILPGSYIPIIFNPLDSRDVCLTIKEEVRTFPIDEVSNKKKKKKKMLDYEVNVGLNGCARELCVIDKIFKEGNDEFIKSITNPLHKYRASTKLFNFQAKIELKRVGISLITDAPAEIFYISFDKITIFAKVKQSMISSKLEQILKFYYKLGNFQIDNMIARGKQFSVIFSPLPIPEEVVPFFQLDFSRKTLSNPLTESVILDQFYNVRLCLQEFKIQLDQPVVRMSLSVLRSLMDSIAEPSMMRSNTMYIVSAVSTDKYLDPSNLSLSFIPNQKANSVFINEMNLESLHLNLTFKSSKQRFEMENDPRQMFGIGQILSSVGGAIINISETPIKLNQLKMNDVFSTIPDLQRKIITHYVKQGLYQLYKILGSSDLIGNPVQLIDKLGKGVYQFISEPYKGLLKNPKEFVKGVGKGVKGLVGGVVTGGFGSISKITGSLYGVLKNVSGDEEGADRIKETRNVVTGTFYGVVGGVKDLGEGVTGIFTKPFKGAKKQGAKGFIKGVGIGLFGAISAPFSAILHFGTSVSSGVANSTAWDDKNKQRLHGRSRFPRQFSTTMVVEKYNHEIAQAQEFLRTNIKNKWERLVMYQNFEDLNDVMILITSVRVLLFIEGEKKAGLKLKQIKHCKFLKVGETITFEMRDMVSNIIISSTLIAGLLKVFETVTAMNNKIPKDVALQQILSIKDTTT
ncbi:unnamed protein product [Blepharisma stoltei]|uniref:Vacuolar protein sorting-associated protein n=1 Tax=Blepharisma stoltei TaxID=1481888 RepID=A0AAU9J257_9CILI|nr:unnamed protein product [Blepharisma stoltei]